MSLPAQAETRNLMAAATDHCVLNLMPSLGLASAAQVSEADVHSNGNAQRPSLLGAEAALRVVAQQLPKIVPHMLINRREGEQIHLLQLACMCATRHVSVVSCDDAWTKEARLVQLPCGCIDNILLHINQRL